MITAIARTGGDLSSTARILFVFVGGVAYFGLAAWGERSVSVFFVRPPLAALTAVYAATLVMAFFVGGNVSRGQREDRRNRWVLAAFSVIGLLGGYLPPFCDHRQLWTIDGDTVRWLGVILFAAGGALRLWPVYVLGDRFSGLVAIQPGHRLMTGGIYRVIRHPSYCGLLVYSLGWGLAFNAWVGVLLTLLTLPPLLARINAEERLLASEFGAEYEAYRARTWRLVRGVY